MLADNPVSVEVDLVRSTAVRALRAVGSVLDRVIGGDGARQSSLHLNTSTSTSTSTSASGRSGSGSNCTPCDPATVLGALAAMLRRLVSTVLTALRMHYYSAAGSQVTATTKTNANANVNAKRPSRPGRGRAAQAQIQKAALDAMDDVMGGVYELVLAPVVRAFFSLSVGFAEACLGSGSGSRSGSRSGTNSPRSNHGSDSSSNSKAKANSPTDLRPALLALLDDTLCALEEVLPASPSPAARPGPSSLSPGLGGAKLAAAIPGAGQVKTLLALECVQELGKLYLPQHVRPLSDLGPASDSTSISIATSASVAIGRTTSDSSTSVHVSAHDSSAAPGPGPGAREPTRGDAASANSDRAGASTSTARHSWTTTGDHDRDRDHGQRTHHDHRQPPRTFPGLAHVLDQTLGSSDDSTRLGTSMTPVQAHPQRERALPLAGAPSAPAACANANANEMIFTGLRSRWASVAGNFGETNLGATSGPGSGPVRGGASASSAGGSHAHVHVQCEEGARGGGGAEDLRRRERVTRLARKDAVWYLCAALHRLLPDAPTGCGPATATDAGANTGAGADTGTGASTFSPPSSGTDPYPNLNAAPDADPKMPGIEQVSSTSAAASADTAAEQAVYDALADLLRRTQPPPPQARRAAVGSGGVLSMSSSSSSSSSSLSESMGPLSSSIVAPCSSSPFSSASASSPASASASYAYRKDANPNLNHAGPEPDQEREPRCGSTGHASRGTTSGPCESEPQSESDAVNMGSGHAAACAGTGELESEDLRLRAQRVPKPKRSRAEMECVPGMEDTRTRTRGQVHAQGGLGVGLRAPSGSVRMGEVERGMLLAVLERAWLGV